MRETDNLQCALQFFQCLKEQAEVQEPIHLPIQDATTSSPKHLKYVAQLHVRQPSSSPDLGMDYSLKCPFDR